MKNIERPEVIKILVNYFADDNILARGAYEAFKKEGFKGELFTSDFKEWANAEYVEPFKITKAEKCILERLLKNKYKVIYLEEGDYIALLDEENNCDDLSALSGMFSWVDKNGYKIKDVLENCEVVE